MFPKHYDVIVAGGGPSGIAAAVAAARQGVLVALIERYGILGGMLTSGHVNPVLGSVSAGTMADELMALLCRQEATSRNGIERSVDPEEAKTVLLRFAADAGVHIYLQTPVVDVIKEDDRVIGLSVGSQDGLINLYAKAVVDATGDGFVSVRAGAQAWIGRETDGRCQPCTMEFTIDHIDESRAITCWGGTDPVKLPDGTKYADFCIQKEKEGVLPRNVSIVRLHKTAYPGERSVNATQANGYNTLDNEGILNAELELRDQVDKIVYFLQTYIPGYENCQVKSTGSTLGVRETRRIAGDQTITDNDVETGGRYPDVIVHKAWFLIDIHNPSGSGQAEGHSQPAIPYDIPYGALLPKGIDGLLTCGRCISGTHRAHASYRVMFICFATGQAAGIAAALSAQKNIVPRQLDVSEIQDSLRKAGVSLFD